MSWLSTFITAGALGWLATITKKDLLRMTYEVSHFEKEVTWLMGAYLDYINGEAFAKDRVVGATELRAILRGKKTAMDHNRNSVLAIHNL